MIVRAQLVVSTIKTIHVTNVMLLLWTPCPTTPVNPDVGLFSPDYKN